MKDVLRRQGIALLKEIAETDREHLSETISQHLFRTKWWKNASIIGVTVAKSFELNTEYIINKAWSEKKIVCVPKCFPKQDKRMVYYRIQNFNQLEEAHFGLLEPNPDETVPVNAKDIDLLLVPGVLFSKDGYRIGFGGGYFDRFLQKYQLLTVALAYSQQIVDELPFDQHDLPVQHIITEKGIIL
jgi:5-formyltetrahydrofolate cyclo-ligase